MMIRRFLNKIALIFCLTAFSGVSDVACADTETPTALGNIMPLGDSITRGNDVLGGYRAPLNTLLTNWLDTFTFVGTQTDNTTPALTAAGQTHHEGHGGYTIVAGGGRSGIDENLVTWIGPSGAAPDKILLMVGTNDIYLPYAVANAPARLSVLIDHIYGFRPSVKLYVASIPPIVGRQADVQAYNATIPGIVASHQALGRNVIYVPMYEALNIATDLDAFGLHPNAVGYQKIAQVWNEALNTTTTGIVTTTTLNSSVNPSVYHQEVVFTATVKNNGVITTGATGNVVFSVDGIAKAFVAVSGGVATYINSTLATGIHTIRAVYVGDSTYAASSVNSTQTNNPGPASKLAFGVQPNNTRPDSMINPAVTVLVQDADGNTVTSDNITDVTVSGTIFSSSTLTVRAVNGVATFSNLKPTTVGNGLTLAASTSLLTGATSNPFNVGVIVISGNFIPPASTTTTVGKWDSHVIGQNQLFWIGKYNTAGAILNQTGGSITITGQYGNFGIGENPNGWGVYNMSGDASFNATSLNGASNVYTFSIQGNNGSKMTMTDNAVANIGSLTFGSYGGWGHLELSGNASLTAGKIGYAGNYTFGSGYITFASNSTATLTITGKGAADYQAYVAAGNIRIDGAIATFSQFLLLGSTLSLAPVVANPTILATQSANGTITPAGANPVTFGSTTTYSVTPDPGYHVATLTVDDVPVTPPATSYAFVNVTTNHTITATFATGTTVTITATQSPNGLITPSGVTTLNYYDNQVYSITPALGYHVNTLTVDGVNVVPATNYTFSNVGSNHAITATYTDIITGNLVPSGNTTTTITGKYVIPQNNSFMVGKYNTAGAILNQTGGSITITGQYGNFGIGENPNGWGVYNMSGDASFNATSLNGASNVYTFSIQGNNGSKMTMTDNAVANIGSLTFGSYGGWGHLELSGNASLTAGKIGYAGNYTFGSGYITFASNSTATLTITGKGAADYQAYVAAGNIRIDGAIATFSQFQVSGDGKALSLAAGSGSFAGWAGGHAFDSLNSEGVAYGMAWILGSPTHSSSNTLGLLPTSQAIGSELILYFMRVHAMTPAQLHLELSDDLSADSWTTSIPVPATSGQDGGLNFVVTGPDSNGLDNVIAHIPISGKTKRFARLIATE